MKRVKYFAKHEKINKSDSKGYKAFWSKNAKNYKILF